MDTELAPAEAIGTGPDTRMIGRARLATGLAQGLAAWLILELAPPDRFAFSEGRARLAWWAERHSVAFAILTLVIAFVPTVALAEIGRMRKARLLVYLAAASVVLALLGAYDIWRDPLEISFASSPGIAGIQRFWPSWGLVFAASIALFIANQLLEHRERGHRLFASYATHFEDSWMRAFQFIVSLVFAGLVWGVLELGKALFGLIHLDWFGRMIEHNWFHCPVLAMAFAAAVHITDIRPALLIGMRNLGLTLLSWLLPLVVVLSGGFLIALGFTGLAPLWATRFAATILLWAVAVTLVLVNAAYKDGDPAHRPVLPIRWAGIAAGPIMLILAVLATYAIALRVGQYGWTPQRVRSAAVAAMALLYGGGYTAAVLRRGAWLQRLEPTNVIASVTALAIVALLLSPLADPERIGVMSQLARLHTRRISPAQFDYQFLRFDAGRYGNDALARLATDANPDIRSRASLERAATGRAYARSGESDASATEAALSHVTVYPAGARLPADFAPANLDESVRYPACLRDGTPCEIIMLGSDTPNPGLLVYDPALYKLQVTSAAVLGRIAGHKWGVAGTLNNLDCVGVIDALRHGAVTTVRPNFDDFEAGGIHLDYRPADTTKCAVPPKPRIIAKPGLRGEAVAPAHMGPAFTAP